MSTTRTRSPQCANPYCVPGTVECPDCIAHNGPTPYQIEVARHKQPPILGDEDANAFLERLHRELYGCTITGGWTPGAESTFTVTDPSGRRGYVRVLHNGKVEYTRPSLWLIPTRRTWLVFAWDDLHAKLFGSR